MNKTEFKIKSDFDWVIKIVKSCDNKPQLEVSNSCFNLWVQKYDKHSNDIVYAKLIAYLKSKYWAIYKTEMSKQIW
jgi:hypothetical protein